MFVYFPQRNKSKTYEVSVRDTILSVRNTVLTLVFVKLQIRRAKSSINRLNFKSYFIIRFLLVFDAIEIIQNKLLEEFFFFF